MEPVGPWRKMLIDYTTKDAHRCGQMLVMAPIAASFAGRLGYNPDPFLMAVAIGAACDFLTPIGHQCNTLVMGPGGYCFGRLLAARPPALGDRASGGPAADRILLAVLK